MRTKKVREAPKAVAASSALDAYLKVEPKLAKVADADLVPILTDVTATVYVVLGALPALRAQREAWLERLPTHPIADLDLLEEYALATWFLHQVATSASTPEGTKAQLEEASRLREDLLVAAEALAHRQLLDQDRVAKIRKGQGHLDTANDLVALAALYTEFRGTIANKTAVDLKEVERARDLGPQLLVAVYAKKMAKGNDPVHGRAQAFSLLFHAWESVRQAITYLRWTAKDADTLAPPLQRKPRGRPRGSSKTTEADEASEASEASQPAMPDVPTEPDEAPLSDE
ncbi:MAG: hypothetical protein WCI05_13615 [Myxococcales bacterium]